MQAKPATKFDLRAAILTVVVLVLTCCVLISTSSILNYKKPKPASVAPPRSTQQENPTAVIPNTIQPRDTSFTATPQSVGATVVFIDPTKTPIPTQTTPLGITRDNPYPLGVPVDIGGQRLLTVEFVTRPADDLVRNGNMFNPTPEADAEFILVDIRVECQKGTNDKCVFTTFGLKSISLSGQIQDQQFVAGIPNKLEATSEFFGGGYVEGSVIFKVDKNDNKPIMIYDQLFGSSIYFSLQK